MLRFVHSSRGVLSRFRRIRERCIDLLLLFGKSKFIRSLISSTTGGERQIVLGHWKLAVRLREFIHSNNEHAPKYPHHRHRDRRTAEKHQTIAVLGIKPESHAYAPAHYVPKYMAEAGYENHRFPRLLPEITTILGKQGVPRFKFGTVEIDLLNVFALEAIPKPHCEILAANQRRLVSAWNKE